MKKVLKQVVGVDVAQAELVVCLCMMHNDLCQAVVSHKVFPNTAKGFPLLLDWVGKLADPSIPVRFVMEATGVYHQAFAYYLHGQGQELSIVLPNKISNYARTLDTKTVTDKTSSEAIAFFGLGRQLDCWVPPKGIYKHLQQLTRERGQLVDERTLIKNQLHAEQAEAEPNKQSMERAKKRVAVINGQLKEIMAELSALAATDSETAGLVKLLCSIPGIGFLTACVIIGETNGFELIRNKRQLTSYAGLDVKEKQSGTSVKGKPHISKKGNRFLRKAMHLPALAAIGHDERFRAVFARLVSKHGIKMKAAVAVQRKLLEMAYTVYKTKKKYDKEYLQKQEKVTQEKEGVPVGAV